MRFEAIGLPVLCLFVAGAGSAELLVSQKISQDLRNERQYCRFFFCDEWDVVYAAYRTQVRNTRESYLEALDIFKDALVRDVAAPLRWADLGDIYSQLDEYPLDVASACYERAFTLGSASAQVVMTCASFYIRYGQLRRGEECISRVLTIAPEYGQTAFSYLTLPQVKSFPEAIAAAVPAGETARSFLNYLVARGDLARSRQLWTWMNSKQYIDLKSAALYSDFLLARRLFPEAAAAWQSQADRIFPGYGKTEFIYNGGLEAPPSGSPFDWNAGHPQHADLSRDAGGRTGKQALKIQFDGEANLEYYQPLQLTFLPAGTYRFQAYFRSAGVSTESRPYFTLTNSATGTILTRTAPVSENSGWRALSATFSIPAPQPVTLNFVRNLTDKFDNQIAGSVWLDDLSLARIQ